MTASIKNINAHRRLASEEAEEKRLSNQSKIDELRKIKENKKSEVSENQKKSETTDTVSVGKERRDPDIQLYDRKGAVNMKAINQQERPIQPRYVTRDEDVFYKVQDRGNQISETSDGFYIDAYAPEHEKDNIRISISSDKAVISGSRKYDNTVELSNKKISNNNFQSFREEFVLSTPVDSNGMRRERQGDYIRFFIPKLKA